MPEPACKTRLIAFDVINDHRETKKFVTDLLPQQFSAITISDMDRRFVTEIVQGVIRRKATLDALIQNQISKPQKEIEEKLWTLLQIGCYQLALMDSVPTHAALFETVNITKQIKKPRWTKFANGVLRGISRNLTSETVKTPSENSFPTRGQEYRLCEQKCFPNPATNTSGYFAEAFSFPHWLSIHWAARFSFEQLCELGFHLNNPVSLSLRINPLKTSRDELLKQFAEFDIAASTGIREDAILLQQANVKIQDLPGFAEGMFVVQNQSAMLASALLAPKAGEVVLDLCAAPGTKTTHLAEIMNNEGTLIATDVDQQRLNKITENATRLNLDVIQTHLIDRDDTSTIPAGPFDAILLDVPCSNSGVLNKRPEARWRISEKEIDELSNIQLQLLQTARERLKPNGRIVYSTCSLEPEENRDIVTAFSQVYPEFKLLKEEEQLPHNNFDGAYAALLQRQG